MCLEVVGNFQEKCLGKIQLQTPTAMMRRVVDANRCGRSQSVFSILGLSRCSWGERLTSVKDLKRRKGIHLRASLQKGFLLGQGGKNRHFSRRKLWYVVLSFDEHFAYCTGISSSC